MDLTAVVLLNLLELGMEHSARGTLIVAILFNRYKDISRDLAGARRLEHGAGRVCRCGVGDYGRRACRREGSCVACPSSLLAKHDRCANDRGYQHGSDDHERYVT